MERLNKIGKIVPKSASEIGSDSRLGLGFEKLDRDIVDPEKAYDKMAAVGAKWIRLQSGWARTEKVPGVYDFEWLDSIVDNLISRGMRPWITLCYGNGLYNEKAAEVFGAVGIPPIFSERESAAWAAYVAEVCRHYKGRVEYYEVWNEPDGVWCWKTGPNGTEYGNLVIATAKAAKAGDPDCKLIGGSACLCDPKWTEDVFATGMADYIDYYSFHAYNPKEWPVRDTIKFVRAMCDRYNPSVGIIQGETGSQSRCGGSGAMCTFKWTPEKQSKQMMRHTVLNLGEQVFFNSYFTCVDMIEALNGRVGDVASYLDYGYFGILGADFDESGHSTGDYTPKKSYYTYQALCSIFSGEYSVVNLPVRALEGCCSPVTNATEPVDQNTLHYSFRFADGSEIYAYWQCTDLLTECYDGTTTLEFAGGNRNFSIIDPSDGTIYAIPDNLIENLGSAVILHNIPLKDYPLLLKAEPTESAVTKAEP